MPIEPMILQIIRLAAVMCALDAPLIAAVIDAESSWNINALGDYDDNMHPQAFGLMQVHIEGAGHGYDPDLLLNPVLNIFLGCRYLKYLEGVFPNNAKLMISAYNQGPGGAAKRGYGYNETYVTNVLNLRLKYEKELKP